MSDETLEGGTGMPDAAVDGAASDAEEEIVDAHEIAAAPSRIPWKEFLESVSLREMSALTSKRYMFAFTDGEDVGTITYMHGNLASQHCRCKVHPQCALWITARGKHAKGNISQRLLRDLCSWLQAGKDITFEGHRKAGHLLKLRYGMQPKS